MTDLIVERLILGQGVIGSFLANRFEKEKVDFAILDIGNEIEALTKATSTKSNVNSNLATHRNSFTNSHGMVWGRGLMMIPESEYRESSLPIDFESLYKSINTISEKFLREKVDSFETYEFDGKTLIDTLCIPPQIHKRFFYKSRDPKSQILEYAALSISPASSGYIVKAVNPSSGNTLEIQTREVFITLGALESVRLLLNSNLLFDKNETNIGRNLCDHVSMATVSVSTSRVLGLSHLSPRNREKRTHPRFYHKPLQDIGLGGFSFIGFDPNSPKSSIRERLLRKVSGQELSPGNSIAITLLETDKSDAAFMELRPSSKNQIPQLHLEFNVSDKFLGEFELAIMQFIDYLSSLDVDFISSFDRASVVPNNMSDSLHPAGVIPFSNSPKMGEFGADFQLHDHPGIFCFSTGMLPRAFSVQPTLTIMGFAEIFLTHSFEKAGN